MEQNIKLYAYLNIEHPMVAWEVAIGRIKSTCDNNEDKFGVSLWQYNLFKAYVKDENYKKLENELKLEKVRLNNFPNQVSRLTGVYFFENIETAHIALERWGIPNKKKYISEIYFSANSITKVDSEWISSYLLSENTDWMKNYWSGKTLGIKPLTEIIASGIGIIQNKELRKKAYENIINKFPDSSGLLATACCAFKYNKMENIALVKPAFINKDNKLIGSFFINMDDYNNKEQDIVKSLELCKQNNEVPLIIKPLNQNIIFSVPDMKSDFFEFEDKNTLFEFTQIHM